MKWFIKRCLNLTKIHVYCTILKWAILWVLYYRKNSKIWDTSNNCHNCPKNRKVWCNIALMHPKDADGMANSVDPDQTASSEAVWSWSALFAETYLSQYIEFVRYSGHKKGILIPISTPHLHNDLKSLTSSSIITAVWKIQILPSESEFLVWETKKKTN